MPSASHQDSEENDRSMIKSFSYTFILCKMSKSESLSENVKQIIAQKESLDEKVYQQRILKAKQLIQQRMRDVELDYRQARRNYQMLKNEGSKEIPEIGLEQEWIHYYQAWKSLLSARVVKTPAHKSLAEFHAQIAENLEKETDRLRKLQQYSEKHRLKTESKHAVRSSHRIKRIQSAQEILSRFEEKMASEQARNYDERIAEQNNISQQLSDKLESLHQQNTEVEEEKAKLRGSNKEIEQEVTKREEAINNELLQASQMVEELEEEKIGLTDRVTLANELFEARRTELIELEKILENAKMMLVSVSETRKIAQSIHV